MLDIKNWYFENYSTNGSEILICAISHRHDYTVKILKKVREANSMSGKGDPNARGQ